MSASRSSTPKPEKRSATFDRGPAKYFHGREDVFEKFSKLAKDAKEVKGGSTFIIQGAPGVGKTALLYECEKLAEKDGWDVVDLKTPAPLGDPAALRDVLGTGKVRNVLWGIGNILANKFAGTDLTSNMPKATASAISVLEKRNNPLLLILDEAQLLGKQYRPVGQQASIMTSVVSAIHNGKLNTPVILLAAGLGGTQQAFRELGISRVSKRCFIELEPLEYEAEHAVIRDFLVKDGGARGDLSEWIEAIASNTHGWPEHIVSYGDVAKSLLRTNHGRMTAEGLSAVLNYGRIGQIDYYKGRVEELRKKHRVCIASVIKDIPFGAPFDIDIIEDTLAEHFGSPEAKRLVALINEKGVVDQRDGEHVIPIPSMHTWLVESYAIEREQNVQSGDKHGLDSPVKTLGLPREAIDSQLTPRDIRVEKDASASSKEQERNPTDQSLGWGR